MFSLLIDDWFGSTHWRNWRKIANFLDFCISIECGQESSSKMIEIVVLMKRMNWIRRTEPIWKCGTFNLLLFFVSSIPIIEFFHTEASKQWRIEWRHIRVQGLPCSKQCTEALGTKTLFNFRDSSRSFLMRRVLSAADPTINLLRHKAHPIGAMMIYVLTVPGHITTSSFKLQFEIWSLRQLTVNVLMQYAALSLHTIIRTVSIPDAAPPNQNPKTKRFVYFLFSILRLTNRSLSTRNHIISFVRFLLFFLLHIVCCCYWSSRLDHQNYRSV